ncbi:MAG: efflux RND transporter permease subunit [Spirochaetales bacterium]|nr:efflux RND transporter permease subunit [Spirochaetales bacterium]
MSLLTGWYDKRTTVLSVLLMILLLTAAGIYTTGFGASAGSGKAGGRGSSIKYTVIIRHYGIDPEEMEKSITIPLEDRISGIYGIEEMRSVSELNTSRIDLSLIPGTDVKEFYIELRDAVYTVYSGLPKSVQKPEIFSSSGNDKPLLIVSLDSEKKDLNFVRDAAEGKIKPKLEKIEGVGEIEVAGGELSEIHVVVERQKAQGFGLRIAEIGRFIRLNYVKEGLGYIDSYGKRTGFIMNGRLSSLEDAGSLEIKTASGELIKLNSIAEIKYGEKEPDTVSRINGRKKVVLYIKSSGTGSPLRVSEMVRRVLAENFKTGRDGQGNAYDGISYEIIYDYGERLKTALKKLLRSIIYAMIIVSFFLLVTLKELRSVFILSLSIPLTAAAAVSVLSLFKIPVGISVLSGLAIGIGLIADTGIIMITAVKRQRPAEKDKAEAGIKLPEEWQQASAWNRVIELIPSLAASAATTVIAVIPLFFIPEGILGIKNVALVYIVLIVLSFVLNVFFLPPLIYAGASGKRSGLKEKLQAKRFRTGRRLKLRRYLLRIFYCTEHFIVLKPAAGIGTAAVFIVLLGLSFVYIPREVFRGATEPVVFCHIEFDSGTNLKTIDSGISRLTSGLLRVKGIEKVESLARRDNGSFSVRYNPDVITRSQTVSAIEAYNDALYNAFIYVPETADKQTSVEVGLIGPDDAYLRQKGREAAAMFQSKPWVSKTVLYYKKGPPEWIFNVNHTRLSKLMLTTEQIANALRWQLYGPVSIKWMDTGKEIDLRVMGMPKGSTVASADSGAAGADGTGAARMSPDKIGRIMNTSVINLKNETVPLKEAGTFSLITGRARIYRLNRQRAVFFGVTSRINDVDELYSGIRKGISLLKLKAGYSYRIDPSLLKVRKDYVKLELLLVLAVALIFMLIASQYESLSAPVPVILSIPFSLSVPFIVIWLSGRALTSSVFIGLIVVTGIVVNNTIILVDDILRQRDKVKKQDRVDRRDKVKKQDRVDRQNGEGARDRKDKLDRQPKGTHEDLSLSILASLRKRIVPMLLTSVSTLLGLIPLFLNRSASSKLVHSLAFVVFWGVIGSVVSSLVIIPAVLAVFPVFTKRSLSDRGVKV